MPKITTSKKKKISSTTVNFIILFLLVLILGAGLYGFYYYYLDIKSEEIATLAESRSELTSQAIVKKLDVSGLIENGYYELQQHGIMSYGEQVKGVPTDGQNPVPPDNFQVINPGVGQELILMWQKPEYALYESVKIYRSTVPGRTGEMIAEDLPASGFFIDAAADNNQTYYYTAHSVNQINESQNKEQTIGMATDSSPPFPPQNLKISSNKEGGIVLTWTNPDDQDFAGCRVYRSSLPGSAGQVVKEGVKDGQFTDDSVVAGENYYYMVTSVDAYGNESSYALAVPPTGNPAPFGSEINEAETTTP